jgi:23S rRNA (guanine745-N1)-methyltransferase
VLAAVVPYLRCPYCAGPLRLDGRVLGCSAGHAFDVARQGYVTLLPAGVAAPTGDTGAMLAARERFLTAGHFAGLAEQVAAAATTAGAAGCLVEVGAGTGYYLAAALDVSTGRVGIALDASKHASRRAARAHSRAGAVVCDVWRALPVRDGVATAVLDVFAPRNGAELNRILAPGGVLVVVTPTPDHLAELVAAAGLLTVDRQKQDRLAGTLDPYFGRVEQRRYDWPLLLSRAGVRDLVEMGPSARHLTGTELAGRLAGLAEPVAVTASVHLSVYRRAG